MGEPRYLVGAAAGAAGVKVQTLHYYERQGLIAPSGRRASGYREYGNADVRRVQGIKRAQALGFTLREIRELIGVAKARRPSRRVGALVEAKLVEIDEKIRDLQQMQRSLQAAREACSCGGDLSRCDALDGLGRPS